MNEVYAEFFGDEPPGAHHGERSFVKPTCGSRSTAWRTNHSLSSRYPDFVRLKPRDAPIPKPRASIE